jgi:hypothetical protein
LILHKQKSDLVFNETKDDICIVTCHFNFIGWQTPVRNLQRFLRNCKKENIQVYGAEAYLNKPVTEKERNWIQVKATNKNICFQKEALLNLVIRNLPKNYTKIIVCDHDIFFERVDWIQECSIALEYFDFIQPFSTCVWTGLDGLELGRRESFFKTLVAATGHPGFSVGFKRSSFEKIYFYPYCIVGGGDTIFAGSVTGSIQSAKLKFKRFFNDYKIAGSNEWYRLATSQNFIHGYINGTIYHEHHGSKKERKYNERGKILKNLNFSNVFINNEGLVEIKDEEKETRDKIYEYLATRNEDS